MQRAGLDLLVNPPVDRPTDQLTPVTHYASLHRNSTDRQVVQRRNTTVEDVCTPTGPLHALSNVTAKLYWS